MRPNLPPTKGRQVQRSFLYQPIAYRSICVFRVGTSYACINNIGIS